ncbi:hypothetical protein [Salisediminibacterium halotolerans]|uniref:Uncharacterized protein n=1 Tax=Salisediminibacterium halotolerans TaxID=517425 RepID=A0A1H9WSW9_9BACI|nr:hypothetical protein [Salisediminibacterium haloalkalitolerans]SES36483.1 hypothetical protein SAMN05444126_14414 [Salisediminibacterium haloalkalitolerans]
MKAFSTVYVAALQDDGSISRKTLSKLKQLFGEPLQGPVNPREVFNFFYLAEQNAAVVGLRTRAKMSGSEMRTRAREAAEKADLHKADTVIIIEETFSSSEIALFHEMIRGLFENNLIITRWLPKAYSVFISSEEKAYIPADLSELTWLLQYTNTHDALERLDFERLPSNISIKRLTEDDLHGLGFGSVHELFAKDPELFEMTYEPAGFEGAPLVVTAGSAKTGTLARILPLVFEYLTAFNFPHPLTVLLIRGDQSKIIQSRTYRLITEQLTDNQLNVNQFFYLMSEAVYYSFSFAPKGILTVLSEKEVGAETDCGDYRPAFYSKAQFGRQIPLDLNEPFLPVMTEPKTALGASFHGLERVAALVEKEQIPWVHTFSKAAGAPSSEKMINRDFLDDFYALTANIRYIAENI